MDDEEEVLLGLAEVLGQFLDYVGGPAHGIHIIKILEKLCMVEETTVRDKVRCELFRDSSCHIFTFRQLKASKRSLPQ
jgi:serine/threonine-protein phosphatase 2A regulatory subunit A